LRISNTSATIAHIRRKLCKMRRSRDACTFLTKGSAVFVLVDDLDTVPLPLRRAADRTINVLPPNRQALIALLHEIAPGTNRFDLLDIPVEQITPRTLGLA
jgi:hypothetical protein